MLDGIFYKPNRLFIFQTKDTSHLEEVINYISTNVPEIRDKDFHIKQKKGKATYLASPKIRIDGKKIILETLEIQQVTPNKFQVHIKYRKRIFRPFYTCAMIIGLICGLIPAIIIYVAFRETENERNLFVQPALERFKGLCSGGETIKLLE